MLCLRCGGENPPRANYCTRCNAVLPRIVTSDSTPPASTIDVEEGRHYLVPQRSFPTEYLYNLTCRAYEYIHENASGTPLLDAYNVVRTRIEAFESNDLPHLLDRLRLGQMAAPDDDYYSQMVYLLKRGVSVMHEGFERMDAFIESGEIETLKEAIAMMQEGNDSLGLGKQLSLQRSAAPNRPPGS